MYKLERNNMVSFNIVKVLTIGTLSFLLSFALAPFLIKFLYDKKCWRKEVRSKSIDGRELEFCNKFHSENETKVPRMGGILIWLAPIILALIFLNSDSLNFLSRSETYLAFFALIVAAILGLVDDLSQIFERGKYIAGGLSLKWRLLVFALMGLVGGWWIYFKLGISEIYVPFVGDIYVGWFYILFFVIVMMATYSGGVIDGLDGLAAGSFIYIFSAFAIIAFWKGSIDLAAFSLAIVGSLLSFLWHNIPPAKFYMGETGTMALCASLVVVAFLSNSILVLPIIAFLLVVESASVIIQLLSKKFRNKKVFLASPIHHHFQALGWPTHKVTMRFWVIGAVCALIGVIIRLLG